MNYEIVPATRQGLIPLVGFYGKSGSGKTMSALLLARGMAGPEGRIVLIDSESGRGRIFADVIPGGYNYMSIEPPFTPDNYRAAFEAAEKQADVIVIDSLTHAHSGEGGVLDMQEGELDRMAGQDWKKREACKMAAWIKPKMDHKKFVQRILRSKCALICCLRGDEKTKIHKEDGQKTKVITDDFCTPDFDKKFIFELLLNLETVCWQGEGGYVIPRKITHPAIGEMLPKESEQIGIAHGRALAEWCAAGKMSAPQKPKGDPERADLRRQIWDAAKDHPKIQNDPKKLEYLLIEAGQMKGGEKLTDLQNDHLRAIAAFVRKELQPEGALL